MLPTFFIFFFLFWFLHSSISAVHSSSPSTLPLPPFLSRLLRCGSGGAGEALHPEAATVLRSLRLPVRPAQRPEMEGSEAGGAERNGGVHHPQQECHHRAHLPRGGAHG